MGDRQAALVAGLRRALDESSDAIVTLPGDAPLAGRLPASCSAAWRVSRTPRRSSGSMPGGREQPLQLALRPAAARNVV